MGVVALPVSLPDPAFMLTDSIMIRLVRLRGFMFTDLVRISSAPDSRPPIRTHYILGLWISRHKREWRVNAL